MVLLATVPLGGIAPFPLQRANVQRDLANLAKRGFTYRVLNNDMIELNDPLSGEKHLKTLREPSDDSCMGLPIAMWAFMYGE